MTTYTKRIAAGGDDGWIRDLPSFDSGGIRIIHGYLSGDIFGSWYRFQITDDLVGAAISSAKLTLRAHLTDSATSDMKQNIYCEDADNPAAPTNKADFDGRTRTTAFTVWDSPEAWTAGSDYDTPDFASAVQEVIDRVGWATNNYLMVIFDDDGSTSEQREAVSYDADSAVAALLTLEYTTNPTPSITGMKMAVTATPAIKTYDTRFKLRARARDTALGTRVRNE